MNNDGGWGGSAPQSDADAWSMDGSEYSPEDLGGSWINQAGMYHLEIFDVKRDLATVGDNQKEKSPSIAFSMQVVHTVEGQSPQGHKYTHRIYLGGSGGGPAKEGSKKAALRFGLAVGILKEVTGSDERKMIVDAQTGSPKITLETWDRAKDEQVIGKIEFRPKDPKDAKSRDKHEFAYDGVWHVLDPAVREVPKCFELVEMKYGRDAAQVACGKATPPPPQAQGANGTAAAPQTAAASAGGMKVDDF